MSAFVWFGSVYGLIILVTRRRLQLNGQSISNLTSKRFKVLHEGLGGIRDVLLSGTQSNYMKVYRNVDLPLRYAMASNQVISGTPRFGVEALGMILIAGLAYILVLNDNIISNVIPVLGALAIGAQRMLPILQQWYSSLAILKVLRLCLKIPWVLEQPLPSYVNQKRPEPMTFESAISQKYQFRYSQETPWVLKILIFKLRKAQGLAL